MHALISQHRPREVYFLGDLFHSLHNSEWQQFEQFIRTYPGIAFTLIRGNHDVLDIARYQELQIRIIPQALRLNQLIFSHEPLTALPEGMINIAGHIHPGCLVRGLGRQSMRLPCFYLKGQTFLLPAFGQLTGLHILRAKYRHHCICGIAGKGGGGLSIDRPVAHSEAAHQWRISSILILDT